MKLRIFLLIFFLIFLATLAYFAYPVVKNRYFSNTSNSGQQDESTKQSPSVNLDDSIDDQSKITDESEDSPESLSPEESISPISESECEDECSSYSTEKEKNSCFEECKISASKDEIRNCANLPGTEKDSCWKERAVRDNKFEYCDNIESASIKKSCKDRLTENILESQINIP